MPEEALYKSFLAEKLAYERLIQRVMLIDKDAAKYLSHEAPHFPSFVHCGALSSCFIWEDTPQGQKYWSRINTILLNTPTEQI